RLASGADAWLSTNVLSSTARTVAPASITSVVRLRWRTLSRTVGHMVRTAAALSSPGAETDSGAASGAGTGGGSGPALGFGSALRDRTGAAAGSAAAGRRGTPPEGG